MAEMFAGSVLFNGTGEIDQVEKITLALGNVDPKRWHGAFSL
jgi:hypothetical protein